ncbi:MAG: VOC family protein [Gammaproteobacteria bacterium]
MPNRHGDYIWYELLTTDANAAETFYGNVIGWTASDSGQVGVDYRLLATADGHAGGMMQLTPDMTAGGARPAWFGYIAVNDVDDSVASITAAGGSVYMPAMDIPGVGRIALLADPQGAPFYVMRGASEAESRAFAYDGPRTGHCAWNELATADRPAAMAFYAEQFGWQQDGALDMGSMGEYEFLRRADVAGPFGAVLTKPAAMPASLWVYYFRVADVDEAVRRTCADGGSIVAGPHEIPGGEYAVNALDPQGALFAFIGPRRQPG